MKRALLLLLPVAVFLLSACSDDPATPVDPVSDTGPVDTNPSADVAVDVPIVDTTADGSPLTDVPEVPPDEGTVTDATTVDSKAPDADPVDTPGNDATAPPIASLCFADKFDPTEPGPDYDQFNPMVATHCLGTNHQDIVDVEQVVFLGDSVTVGTPNLAHPLSTDNSHFFRNLLAEWLAAHYGLNKGNDIEWGLWKAYDYVQGKGSLMEAGDFKNCSKWGARTDDLLEGGGQIHECLPDGTSDKRTLFVFTMGGNDISKITQEGGEASEEEVAAGYPESWELAENTIQYLKEALEWIGDPANFPNGSYVIFANPFEFTDGSGDVSTCATAALAGYKTWENPAALKDIVIYITEQYTKLAVDTQTDVMWMLEHFCGHGYATTGDNADTSNQCYQGPDAELYFDETCTHPSPPGHKAIYEMFKAAVLE